MLVNRDASGLLQCPCGCGKGFARVKTARAHLKKVAEDSANGGANVDGAPSEANVPVAPNLVFERNASSNAPGMDL